MNSFKESAKKSTKIVIPFLYYLHSFVMTSNTPTNQILVTAELVIFLNIVGSHKNYDILSNSHKNFSVCSES